jgi:hypothetical protein
MNKLDKLIAVANVGCLGIAIYDYNIHAIIGWASSLVYISCYQVSERKIRKMQDER